MPAFNEICLIDSIGKLYREILEEKGLILIELNSSLDIYYTSSKINLLLKNKEKSPEGVNFFNFIQKNFFSLPISIETLEKLPEGKIYTSTTEEFFQEKLIKLEWSFIKTSMLTDKSVLVIIETKKELVNNHWHSILISCIDQFECFVFLKDIDSRFIGANKKFLSLHNFESAQQLYNKTDYDMDWSFTESNAYVSDDKKVIQEKKPIIFINETQTYQNVGIKKRVITSKYPLYDSSSQVIGLIGFYIYATEANQNLSLLRFIDNKWEDYNHSSMGKNWDCIYENNKIRLTSREIQCAELLMKGLSAKSIAFRLNISSRTVEKHMEHLKKKFNCFSKERLLNKLIKSNLLELINK